MKEGCGSCEYFDDAREFLNSLRGSNSLWDGARDEWAFRGHRNSAWKLLPSAWREVDTNPIYIAFKRLMQGDDPQRLLKENPARKNELKAMLWTYAEQVSLNEFRLIAYRMGFDVRRPAEAFGDNYSPFKPEPSVKHSVFDSEVNMAIPLVGWDVGMAQHYGIPTRCLDWTLNPSIAVLFAAETIFDPRDSQPSTITEGDDLAVWAVNMRNLQDLIACPTVWLRPEAELEERKKGIGNIAGAMKLFDSYVPPRKNNEFIKAQKGILIDVDAICAYVLFLQTGHWPTFEDIMSKIPDQLDNIFLFDHTHPTIRKFVLKSSEVFRLRDLLYTEGLCREEMMPTLENAAQAALRNLCYSKSNPKINWDETFLPTLQAYL